MSQETRNERGAAARKVFKDRVRRAIKNPILQTALDNNAQRRRAGREKALSSLRLDPQNMRERARSIRWETISNLDRYLVEFVENLRANGIQVHRAADGDEARRIILEIARRHDAKTVAKSKSMVSEEIHLNPALEAAGIRPVETDLGEFIVQLRQEPPAHIITPAVHLRREDVAETFQRLLGMPYTTDVKAMNDVARRELRQVFLTAEIGLSGVNFGVAESGTLCIVTNEGNGRMVTSVPPVHIALMGLERLVPTLADLDVMLQLLPRAATGQKLTSYVQLLNAPRREADPDGPQERHLILLDNGRTRMAQGPLVETLLCIRCGACLNACPVYQEIGGHAYGSNYPGPIGSLVSPGLYGIEQFGHLAKASTLCGACTDACPVMVDFPTLLARVRDQYVRSAPQPEVMRRGLQAYAWVARRPGVFRLAQKVAGLGSRLAPRKDGWLRRLPPPANAWTASRDFPPFAAKPFRERFKERRPSAPARHVQPVSPESGPRPVEDSPGGVQRSELWAQFTENLEALSGRIVFCSERELVERLSGELADAGAEQLLVWGELQPVAGLRLTEVLSAKGFELLDPTLPTEGQARREYLQAIQQAQAGLTGAAAVLADTATLVLPAGPDHSQLASLLPPLHLAVVREDRIFPHMAAWLAGGGGEAVRRSPATTLISGPSRTADIEMTLTVGVHGPERLIVFCVQDAEAR